MSLYGSFHDPGRSKHPTLLEISDRQAQIDYWDAKFYGGRRLLGHAALVLLPVGVLGFCLDPSWVGLVACMLILWAGVRCARLYIRNPAPPSPRPHYLFVVPFADEENRYLLKAQEHEPFRAMGVCPGCGSVQAHPLRAAEGEPSWATVIRRCGICAREWAQS